jgi:hypothetical protein
MAIGNALSLPIRPASDRCYFVFTAAAKAP